MHVLDASRVVDVVSSLLSDERRDGVRADEPRAAGSGCASSTARRREQPLLPYEAALANRLKIDWARETLPTPSFVGRRVLDDVPLGRAGAVHRLDVLLRGVGAEGALSGDPRSSAVRRGGARAVRQRAGAARSHRRREAADRARASTASGRPRAKATTSSSTATREHVTASWRGSTCCASRKRSPTASRICRSPTSSRRDRRADVDRLHRRVRRHGRPRRRRSRAAIRARRTTTTTRFS